jgi:protoporphyrinogen oxidase
MVLAMSRHADAPFVILGAGPCGLAAAWHLARAGVRPLVLEREPLVGGLCATHERDGFRFDLGGHRFVSADEELSRWLERLLGDDLLTRERKSKVLHDGRMFRYPLEAADLVRNLGVAENARALAGYARARLERTIHPRADVSFEDWVSARFGRALYDTFFGPYSRKLWGVDPSRISADWAAERISLLDLGDAALRLAGVKRPPIRTYARSYLYPRFGMGQLYDAIARDVRALGGEIRTSVRVAGIDTNGRRVTFVRVQDGARAERIPASQVLSTIALPAFVSMLRAHEEADDGALLRASRALRFRALSFLNVMLRRSDFTDNTWMYVASGDLRISRIQEPKRRSEQMAPAGRTSIMLELPCDAGDEVWTAPKDALLAHARGELAKLGFPLDDVIDAFVVRVEHGYPVYHLGYDRDRATLLAEVARFENVRTAGRQGLFRYVFMDAAMKMGALAAKQMIEGRTDAAAIDRIGRAKTVVEATALTA